METKTNKLLSLFFLGIQDNMLCLDKWSQKLVLIFIVSGVVLGWLSHMPVKLTKESNDTNSFPNSYSEFPDHLTSIFDHCHHSTMSIPPNMGYEIKINTPVQITDLANAFIYSCLVLFSLCHISILMITVTFVLLDTFFSSYKILWYKLVSTNRKPMAVL